MSIALAGLGRRARDHLRRQAGDFAVVLDMQTPRIGCVLNVVLEGGLSCGERLHDFLEAGLFVVGQIHARQAKVAQRVFDHAFLCAASGVRQALIHGGVGLLQPRVL